MSYKLILKSICKLNLQFAKNKLVYVNSNKWLLYTNSAIRNYSTQSFCQQLIYVLRYCLSLLLAILVCLFVCKQKAVKSYNQICKIQHRCLYTLATNQGPLSNTIKSERLQSFQTLASKSKAIAFADVPLSIAV